MEEKEFDSINVIPLVDIMLVLLTIVLTAATFIVQGSLPVDLPKASQVQPLEMRSYQIVIQQNGDFLFEGKKVEFSELREIVKSINKNSQIAILADRSAQIQNLVKVLDLLKEYDFKKTYLRTELIR
ncbi:MAG: biopolymer transporter ExbD [Thermodesulfobacteriaceae bacterium]|nr:biopolymer transporter ExbD [Thermodesulfobacteriaceae bacterium]MCX8041165.1 biopolymer transporter ExbD [Thermodesulfobacteriaceae bacterium]MDW8135785.1 biopolymer transporter ExbD [Thermodesulfobacterium sp.]